MNEGLSAAKGTTTVGLICKDGVILAADRRATMGNMITSKEVTKIFQIDDHLAIAGAGLVGDILSMVRLLRAEARLYRARVGREMSVKVLTTLMANVLHGGRGYGYFAWFLVGGYDTEPRLYSIDAAGGVTEEKYVAAGSGMEFALAILENEFSEGLSLEDGMRLAAKAVNAAIKRDVYTGEGITLVVVTKEGYRELGDDEIKTLLE
ncbi:archaeal proteasome endopeptidase complex subunit beta [Thermococcus waiotapuensis]|uniref:Proteasome subunit beta n=1 Tax=Thermococcus waiotapuensis TaxID=90909 RepID=A0AAE4NS84_9EURY|nr:archaeal proteasome endopeptidase complex subunit beta [Thermococcus waiotapuensis]MDV3103393.1 archaeal proteasome endopeptidase complex subunit beta [Thermococcus waiotapuensis]